MKIFILIAGSIAALSLITLISSSPRHTVVRVIDGDTIQVSGYDRNIRLIGIDTPEAGECYRDQSTEAATRLLLGKPVRIRTDENDQDNFGRILAYAYLPDGSFVNKELLKSGAGMFFYDSVNIKHQQELIDAAEAARTEGAGLWTACGPCEVKGNYDTSGRRYYHLPQFRHYSQTLVNLDQADRWFCSEEAASRAGFTRARD